MIKESELRKRWPKLWTALREHENLHGAGAMEEFEDLMSSLVIEEREECAALVATHGTEQLAQKIRARTCAMMGEHTPVEEERNGILVRFCGVCNKTMLLRRLQ